MKKKRRKKVSVIRPTSVGLDCEMLGGVNALVESILTTLVDTVNVPFNLCNA